jgi:CDP-diacylglycerol---serine O-phosphatidyltransferase
VLTIGSLAYLVSLPFGWWSYREQERQASEAAAAPRSTFASGAAEALPKPPITPPPSLGHSDHGDDEDRPSRLN